MSEVEDVNGEKVSVGIDELRVVFQSYAAAIANITARWYDGIVPHDESRLDPGPVDARLTGINGGLDRAFVSPTEDGAPVSSFSAAEVNDLLWLTLEYSYRVLGGPHETRLEVVERFEDGFAIRRQSVTLTAEEQFIGEATRLRVGVEPRSRGRRAATGCMSTRTGARWRRSSTRLSLSRRALGQCRHG